MNALTVPTEMELPAHLQEHGLEGQELLQQYVIPPRLKVMQPTRREPYRDFPEGSVVAVPLNVLVAEYSKEFGPALQFVPLFFWPEWCAWNPLASQGQLKAIRDRTFDKTDIIAIKARDEKKRKSEICPEFPRDRENKPQYISYVEHLNFLVFPLSGVLAGSPVCMTFDRGEHRQGTKFSGLIQQRKAPPWGCQFEAVIRQRTNTQGTWYGMDVDNPRADSISPWSAVDQKDLLRGLYLEAKKAYDTKTLQVDYGDDSQDEGEAPKNSKEF